MKSWSLNNHKLRSIRDGGLIVSTVQQFYSSRLGTVADRAHDVDCAWALKTTFLPGG